MEKYGFLMVDYNTPDFIKELQSSIPKDELYEPNDDPNGFKYGIENETHVTIAPCLNNDTKLWRLKLMLMPLSEYKAKLDNISVFRNKDFDVLKCDVISEALLLTNNLITSAFETHSEFNEYHPHVTIAYLKKGNADKYTKDSIKHDMILTPSNFTWSNYEGDTIKRTIWK